MNSEVSSANPFIPFANSINPSKNSDQPGIKSAFLYERKFGSTEAGTKAFKAFTFPYLGSLVVSIPIFVKSKFIALSLYCIPFI